MRSSESSDDDSWDHSLVHDIIQQVSEAEGADPLDLDMPLHDVIDPSALERLFNAGSTVQSVRFDYLDWTVEIRQDQEITLTERDSDR